jgi:HK97 gp10 family phage protein
MAITHKIHGLKEVERNLRALEKHTTAKGVARRVLKLAGKPVADKAQSLAPDDPSTSGDDLKASIGVSTRLNKRQARAARRGGKSGVEVYVGTSDPAGIQQEFGNRNHPAQSFMRPAWMATKLQALKVVTDEFMTEVSRAAKRLAQKRAKGR